MQGECGQDPAFLDPIPAHIRMIFAVLCRAWHKFDGINQTSVYHEKICSLFPRLVGILFSAPDPCFGASAELFAQRTERARRICRNENEGVERAGYSHCRGSRQPGRADQRLRLGQCRGETARRRRHALCHRLFLEGLYGNGRHATRRRGQGRPRRAGDHLCAQSQVVQ